MSWADATRVIPGSISDHNVDKYGPSAHILTNLVLLQVVLLRNYLSVANYYFPSCIIAKSSFIRDSWCFAKCQFELLHQGVKHSLYSTKDQVVAPKSQGLKVLIYLGCQTFFLFYQILDCSIKGWRVYLVLNRGGSGTSKSIPLRLWYLGSGYVFGKYLFFIFIFTQFDTIAQSWGQLPIFFLRSYLKSKIRWEIPLILLTCALFLVPCSFSDI